MAREVSACAPSPCAASAFALLLAAARGRLLRPRHQVHGYVPPAADIARITPGVDTAAHGRGGARPALEHRAPARLSAWFYVQSTFENYTYHRARVVDRTVLVVSFNAERDRDRRSRRYGLEDGRIVDLTARTTETGGRQLGIVEQLFGNLLNLGEAVSGAEGE